MPRSQLSYFEILAFGFQQTRPGERGTLTRLQVVINRHRLYFVPPVLVPRSERLPLDAGAGSVECCRKTRRL